MFKIIDSQLLTDTDVAQGHRISRVDPEVARRPSCHDTVVDIAQTHEYWRTEQVVRIISTKQAPEYAPNLAHVLENPTENPSCSSQDAEDVLESVTTENVEREVGRAALFRANTEDLRQQLGLPKTTSVPSHGVVCNPDNKPEYYGSVAWVSLTTSFQGFYKQRFNCQSTHVLWHGRPRFWLLVPPRHSESLEARIASISSVVPQCSQFVTHQNMVVPPSTLRKWNITFTTFVQHQCEAVWTDYGVYCYHWNAGPNIVEEMSCCDPGWQKPPLYQDCRIDWSCGPAQMRLTTPQSEIHSTDDGKFQARRPISAEPTQDGSSDSVLSRKRPRRTLSTDQLEKACRSSAQTVRSPCPDPNTPESTDSEFFISTAWQSGRRLPRTQAPATVKTDEPDSTDESSEEELSPSLDPGLTDSDGITPNHSDGPVGEHSEEAVTALLRSRHKGKWRPPSVTTAPPSPENTEGTATETILQKEIERPAWVLTSVPSLPQYQTTTAAEVSLLPSVPLSQQDRTTTTAEVSLVNEIGRPKPALSLASSSKMRKEGQRKGRITISSSPDVWEPASIDVPLRKENDVRKRLQIEDGAHDENEDRSDSTHVLKKYEEEIETLIRLGIKYQNHVIWPTKKPKSFVQTLTRFRPYRGRDSWIDDEGIHALLAVLTRDREDVLVLNSLEFAKAFREQKTTTIRLESEGIVLVLVPIFQRNNHWFLASLDMVKKAVTVHESETEKPAGQFLLKMATDKFPGQAWHIHFEQRYHNDGDDCGLYLIAEAEELMKMRPPNRHPIALRKRYLGFLLHSLVKENHTVELLDHVGPKPLISPGARSEAPHFLSVQEPGDENFSSGQPHLEKLASAIGCEDVISDLKSAILYSKTLPQMAISRLDMAMQVYDVGDSNGVVGWLQKDLAALFVANRFTELQVNLRTRTVGRGNRGRGTESEVYDLLELEWNGPQRQPGLRKRLQAVNYRGQKLLKTSPDRPLWMFFPGRKMASPDDSTFVVTPYMYRDLSISDMQVLVNLVRDRRPELWDAIPQMYCDIVGYMRQYDVDQSGWQ